MDTNAIANTSEVVKVAVKRIDDFVGRAFGPALDGLGGWLGDRVKIWRLLNLSKTIDKVEEKLPKGVSVDSVKRKLLAEWIDSASLEADESLQEMWAGMLASAVVGNEPHPSFVSCLRQMSRLDALFLATNAKLDPKRPFDPRRVRVQLTELDIVMQKIQKDTGETFEDEGIDVTIDNLSRLNLLHQSSDRQKWTKAMISDEMLAEHTKYRNLDYITVAPTDLGYALLRVCSGPTDDAKE